MPAYRSIVLCLLTALPFASAAAAEPAGSRDAQPSPVAGMASGRPLDFWTGEWDLRLGPVDSRSDTDESIAARASLYPILNDKALLELWESASIKGLSLRYYSRDNDHWATLFRWTDGSRGGVTSLDGHATGGRGRLSGRHAHAAGESILERRPFSDITPFSLRRYDMISTDGVQASRKQWGMAFTRTSPVPGRPEAAQTAQAAADSCGAREFRAYESIVGRWDGTLGAEPASLSAMRVLDGCAVMAFMTVGPDPGPTRFLLFGYDKNHSVWTIDYLDDDRETDLAGLASADSWTDTAGAGNRLRFDLDGATLRYRFRRADGVTEEGRFVRQNPANP